jgi:hypothetical protein
MSKDFIKPNKQTYVRLKERDTSSDTNYLSLKAYHLFLKETKRKDITYKQFCGVPKKIHLKLMERLLRGRYSLRFPNFGSIKIVKTENALKEGKHTIINWKYYKETGIKVPYRNSHTDGAIYKFHLYPYSKRVAQFGFYDLRMSNRHKKALADAINNNKINISPPPQY